MSTDPSSVDTGAEVSGTEVDKINTGALGTLVAVGLFAMLSITAAVTALVRHDVEVEEASKDASANQVVTELKASQHSALNGPPGYVDRGKGLVSLPIDLAKGLVVAELARDPNSATPPAKAAPVSAAVVDSDAGAAKLATEPASDGGKPPVKPEAGREVQKPAPGSSSKPSPVPTPTPTAATPGAQVPGPTNK
ncbi:MAG TPA: hypothetical protein VJV79_08200 [Polyangiaceae bacterium]|nr:hypothetical protein [Polyangiaceae bacterium]